MSSNSTLSKVKAIKFIVSSDDYLPSKLHFVKFTPPLPIAFLSNSSLHYHFYWSFYIDSQQIQFSWPSVLRSNLGRHTELAPTTRVATPTEVVWGLPYLSPESQMTYWPSLLNTHWRDCAQILKIDRSKHLSHQQLRILALELINRVDLSSSSWINELMQNELVHLMVSIFWRCPSWYAA